MSALATTSITRQSSTIRSARSQICQMRGFGYATVSRASSAISRSARLAQHLVEVATGVPGLGGRPGNNDEGTMTSVKRALPNPDAATQVIGRMPVDLDALEVASVAEVKQRGQMSAFVMRDDGALFRAQEGWVRRAHRVGIA
jgi:hypothetical protein